MNVSHLKRDAEKVKTQLMEVNNSLITKEKCKIYVPENYLKASLASLGDNTKIVGVYGIVYNDSYYGVSKAAALINTEPSIVNYVTINNEKYLELFYNKSDVIIKNLNLVKTGTLVYRLYNETIAKGKVPWYFNLTDMATLFDTAFLHAGVNLHADFSLLSLLTTSMARAPYEIEKYYRHYANDKKTDLLNPSFIPLKDVVTNTSNTLSKLLGNNYSQAITSALVTETETVESIEKLLIH